MEQQFNNLTPPSPSLVKRPKLISIFCIYGFVGITLVLFGWIFLPIPPELVIQPHDLSIIALLKILFDFIGLVGYWKMRKWGVYVFTTTTTFFIGYQLINSTFGIFGNIFSIVLIAVGFANLKKMT